MATYSEKDFDTKHYDDARPSYPGAFYDTLLKYHGGKKDVAMDIGCGSGFVAFELTKHFESVIGTDLSPTMIQQCTNDVRTSQSNIKFLVGAAEEAPEEIEPESVDLITGAECCHWVDHPRFFRESHRVLKKGGTLAYWFYKDPIFVGFPEANDIYDEFCYENPKYMGPCWQQPGRNYLRTLLREIEVPGDLFEDVTRVEYDPLNDENKSSLFISRTINLAAFRDYVTSWSAYHSWKKRNGGERDVADQFIDRLKETFGWDDEFKFEVVWATVYTFGRRR